MKTNKTVNEKVWDRIKEMKWKERNLNIDDKVEKVCPRPREQKSENRI